MSISADDVRRSNVKYRYNYRKSTIATQIFSFIILIVTSAFLITSYLSPIKASIWTEKYDIARNMKPIFFLIGILFFILSIVVLIKIPALKKSFLCITENGIFGIGGKAFFFATQSFTIPSDQITNVKKKGNSVVIESGGNSYQCIIQDAQGAFLRISALRNSATKNDDTKTWVCPKCGKINQNYVGSCGCGEIKPR
ncbi:hypothetical protein [uncultured Ruminococcus sp.]|uniref:hypothetical protein n=1 Tax=uncultured Ruminococcus sp. TaxID=165186 RepID=UPI0025EB5B37|nr:hypothetical protein [uncultured Ruminococcus sp.]